MRFLPSGRVRRTAVVAVVVGLAAGGIAYASIPDSKGVIHGCYYLGSTAYGGPRNGTLRVIDPSSGATCAGDERSLNWNQKGATGPTGPSDGWFDARSVDLPADGSDAVEGSVS